MSKKETVPEAPKEKPVENYVYTTITFTQPPACEAREKEFRPLPKVGEVYKIRGHMTMGDMFYYSGCLVIKQVGSELCGVCTIEPNGFEVSKIQLLPIIEILKNSDHIGWKQSDTWTGHTRPIKLK